MIWFIYVFFLPRSILRAAHCTFLMYCRWFPASLVSNVTCSPNFVGLSPKDIVLGELFSDTICNVHTLKISYYPHKLIWVFLAYFALTRILSRKLPKRSDPFEECSKSSTHNCWVLMLCAPAKEDASCWYREYISIIIILLSSV